MIRWFDDRHRRYSAAPRVALCAPCFDALDEATLESAFPPPLLPPTFCTHCGHSAAALGYQVADLLPLLQRGAYLFYDGYKQGWYVRPPLHRPAEPWYAVSADTAQALVLLPQLRRVDLGDPGREQWYAVTHEPAPDHLTRILSQQLLLHADDQLLAQLLDVRDNR